MPEARRRPAHGIGMRRPARGTGIGPAFGACTTGIRWSADSSGIGPRHRLGLSATEVFGEGRRAFILGDGRQ
jgi:hypothetical protein